MSRSRTDCEGFHRRDVLRVGVAGLLGMSLPDALRAEAAGRPGPAGEEAGDRSDPDLARRGAGDDRHVGPQARRPRGDPGRVPPDRHVRAGGHDLRAHAGAREGHGPLHAGPFARPLDQRPRPRHDLHGHREPAGAGAGVPRDGMPWRRGCCRRGRASRPTSRSPRCETGISGTGPGYLGPAFGPFEVEGDPARGTLQSRGVSLPDGVRTPRPGGPRGPAGPVRPRPAGARLRGGDGGPRPLPSPGRGDPPVRPGPGRARPVARTGRAARRLRPDDAGPGGAGGAAADRGRGPVRDAGLRRLGHPRQQLPRPQGPPPAAAGQGDLDPGPRPGVPRAAGRDDRRLRRGVRPDSAGQRARPGATTGRGRWPCSWPAAGSPAAPSTGRPTTAGRPRCATPVPPTTWPPRCSGGWDSAPGTNPFGRWATDRDLPGGALPGTPGGLSDPGQRFGRTTTGVRPEGDECGIVLLADCRLRPDRRRFDRSCRSYLRSRWN